MCVVRVVGYGQCCDECVVRVVGYGQCCDVCVCRVRIVLCTVYCVARGVFVCVCVCLCVVLRECDVVFYMCVCVSLRGCVLKC